MKTIIMAGGKGTRISSVTTDCPKPMIKIDGKPVLEREIDCLRDQGFTDLIITVSHLADNIIDYFGDGTKFNVNIEYYIEPLPLGNGGALLKLRHRLNSDFLLLNADALFEIDIQRFVQFHKKKESYATLFTHPNNHPYDSGLIIANEKKEVEQWLTKEDCRPQWYKNRVNAGFHIINPLILDMIDIKPDIVGTKTKDGNIVKVDLDRQILKPLCGSGKMFCYDSPEYIKDMGTPERYESVINDFMRGRIKEKSLKYKQKAIFLDRDGTINKFVPFLKNIEKFQLLPGVIEAIKRINESGYLAIVVSNQPVIARGEVSFKQLQEIHNKMETLLGVGGAFVDAIYFCPHHPHKGYVGEISELKIDCECRKPKPGMLMQAAIDFNIDLSQSWLIGDSEIDIKAGKAASCKTGLIGYENFGQDVASDSLYKLVKIILPI